MMRGMSVPARSLPVDEPEAAPPPASGVLGALGPDITFCLLCAAALTVVGRLFGAHYVLRLSTMLLPGLVAPGILAIAALRGRFRAEALWTLRDWAPLVFVAVVFDNLENYTGLVRKLTIDNTLYHIDLAIFGVEPIGVDEAPLSPARDRLDGQLLRDLPHHADVPRHRGVAARAARGLPRAPRLAVMLQMWIAFFMFICLPAGPPRYFAPLRDGPFQTVLPSFFGFNAALQARWDTYSPLLVRASFPSLHCAYATFLTLVYAWRFGDGVFSRHKRAFFWLVLPLELSLPVSTVYLRHHWIPDIAAGIVLALVVCRLAPWLRARWPR